MEHIRIKPAGWLLLLFAITLPTVWIMERSAAPKSKLGRPLRVGIEVWPGYAAGIYANGGFDANAKSLFYQDCELEVQFRILRATDQSRDSAFTHMTADGKPDPKPFDVVWSTIDFAASELPRLRKKNPPIDARVFLQLDWSRGGDAIVVDNSIQNIAGLKGKTVSLDWHGPSGWLLASALNTQGLPKANDFLKVDDTGDPKKSLDKFVGKEKKVDAAVLWEPYVTEARRRPNSHVLLSTRKAANLIADVLVARKDFIDTHKDVLTDFCRCWLKAVEDVSELPARAVKPLMTGYESGLKTVGEPSDSNLFKSPEETKAMLGLVAFAGEAENAELFGLYRHHRQENHPLFDIIFNEALKLMSDDPTFKPEDAKDTSILDGLLSPPAQPVKCKDTEKLPHVISTTFRLAVSSSRQPDDASLHDLADRAQMYSHACILVAGAHAKAVKDQLIEGFDLNETRFLVRTDSSADSATVYVLPDDVDKSQAQAQLGDGSGRHQQ